MGNTFRTTAITSIVDLVNFTSVTVIGNGCFRGCRQLRVVDYPSWIQAFGNEAHYYSAVTTFIIRATTPPTLSANMFNYGSVPTNFYVPDDSVDLYKSTSYWSTWANRIKPLSEYTG